MASLPGILIKIGTDTRDAIQGINRVDKRLGTAATNSQKFGVAMSRAGKVAAGALAGAAVAAAGLAVKIGVDGVQAAIDDQSSQAKLALALKNTTKATDAQVAAMEDYIDRAQEKTGLDDGELRTGLARLLRSTKDATRAQQLSDTALEISIATGKDYATVTNALAKANDGQTQSLKRLGITLPDTAQNYADLAKANKDLAKYQDAAAMALDEYGPKSKQYATALAKVNKQLDKITTIKSGGTKWLADLNKQFAGSIAADADTYAGRIRRLGTAFSELEESFGQGLLSDIGGPESGLGDLTTLMYDNQDTVREFGTNLAGVAASILAIAGALSDVKTGIENLPGGVDVLNSLGNIVGGPGMLIGNATQAFNAWQNPPRPAGSVAAGATGSPDRPWTTFDPVQHVKRTQDADARARARAAKSRARP